MEKHFCRLRYYIAALPFLLVMKGLFVEWLWVRARPVSVMVLLVLLLSNIASYPFLMPWKYTDPWFRGSTLGMHFFKFVNEIHQPYPDPGTIIAQYLRKHAKPDDTVYVELFYDREMLTAMVGDHVLFCCSLQNDNAATRRLMSRLQVPRLAMDKRQADWIVLFNSRPEDQQLFDDFDFAASFTPLGNSTHRPAIHEHAFTPIIDKNPPVFILPTAIGAVSTKYRAHTLHRYVL